MILDRVPVLAPIELPLQEAFGCVLATDMIAEGDMPAFSSSAMDGFAVRASDVSGATVEEPASLRVVGQILVGREPQVTVGAGEAVRIATGAPIPAGADAVVPIEHCVAQDESVLVLREFSEGASVRPTGQDVRAGQILVPEGRRLAGPELGLLASAGHGAALVHPRARVAVLSTGDELVDPGRQASFGQVRDANAYMLFGALRDAGAVPYLGGIIQDDPEALKEAVLGLASRADCFISSGGVSVGERDVVKKAFFKRGDVEFYRVAMQPGMPQFIRPALLKMMGRRDIFRPHILAVLGGDISGPRDKVQFARVRVWRDKGEWRAAATGPSASNLLSTVAKANGLAMIPVGIDTAPAGSQVRVMLFRALEDQS